MQTNYAENAEAANDATRGWVLAVAISVIAMAIYAPSALAALLVSLTSFLYAAGKIVSLLLGA